MLHHPLSCLCGHVREGILSFSQHVRGTSYRYCHDQVTRAGSFEAPVRCHCAKGYIPIFFCLCSRCEPILQMGKSSPGNVIHFAPWLRVRAPPELNLDGLDLQTCGLKHSVMSHWCSEWHLEVGELTSCSPKVYREGCRSQVESPARQPGAREPRSNLSRAMCGLYEMESGALGRISGTWPVLSVGDCHSQHWAGRPPVGGAPHSVSQSWDEEKRGQCDPKGGSL